MLETYSGATKIIPLLGHPVVQTKSPYGMTKALAERDIDAIVVPIDVAPNAVSAVLNSLDRVENLGGVLATFPHKFALCDHAGVRTQRASFFGSANAMRRTRTGEWQADMLDGIGFVRAIRRRGGGISDRHVFLVGAGGAGGAIAFELLHAGAASIAVQDIEAERRDRLIAKLNKHFADKASAGSVLTSSYDLVINATPLGMQPDDPTPIDVTGIDGNMFVGDVVTAPSDTPLIAAAKLAEAACCSGHDMFDATLEMQLEFFIESWA